MGLAVGEQEDHGGHQAVILQRQRTGTLSAFRILQYGNVPLLYGHLLSHTPVVDSQSCFRSPHSSLHSLSLACLYLGTVCHSHESQYPGLKGRAHGAITSWENVL